MAKKLSIDDIIYQGLRDINPNNPYSLNPQSGGIRVDWGGGDVDILTGETWGIETTSFPTPSNCLGERFVALEELSVYNPLQSCSSYSSRFPNGTIYLIKKDTIFCISNCTGSLCGSFCNWQKRLFYIRPDGTQNAASLLSGWNISGLYIPDAGEQKVTVTTNTGVTSSRNTTTSPNVTMQPGGCILTINYLDGSSSQIKFNECPTDIQLVEDCPPCIPSLISLSDRILGKLS